MNGAVDVAAGGGVHRDEVPNSEDTQFEFVPDELGGVTVMRDGHPRSHVDLNDPHRLEFEYVQHLGLVIDNLSPSPPTPLAVSHIGGAGLTLARYLESTRAGSPQIVLEPDGALTDAVRRELPLPRGHRIRVRPELGQDGVRKLRDASADVIVLDAFADGRVPGELVTPQCVREYARVLKADGVLLANLADEPGLRWVSRAIATFRQEFGHCVAIAGHEIFKGRRFGNVVVGASRSALALDVDTIRRAAAKSIFPTGVKSGPEIEKLAAVLPFSDAQPLHSPVPPQLGAWRVR